MTAVLADFNVADAKDLHVKDASRLIDQLKSGSVALRWLKSRNH